MENSSPNALVSEQAAAKLLGCSVHTLRSWRTKRTMLPWVRVGRLVRYAVTDIENFINSGKVELK